MQTAEKQSLESKLETIGNVLRVTGWIGLAAQIGLGAIALLMVMFAIAGRSFSQATAVSPNVVSGVGVNVNQGVTPGIGIGIFWSVCGIAALLVGIFFAFRQTRYAKRLRHADTLKHPAKSDVMNLLRLSVIVGLVGMLLTILGGGATLGVLLSKAIAQPQGVAIYDPTRVIRSLDIMVAMANMSGIAAHFVGTVASLSVFEWLRR
jgi:small-conductance mechanosensitive channel